MVICRYSLMIACHPLQLSISSVMCIYILYIGSGTPNILLVLVIHIHIPYIRNMLYKSIIRC